MGRDIRVLVACGSGIATSAIAVKKIESACEEVNVSVKVDKCSMMDLQSKASGADVIFTTNNYRGDCGKPVMNVVGLITGIGKNEVIKNVQKLILEVNEKINGMS